jgi:hypothetical protein
MKTLGTGLVVSHALVTLTNCLRKSHTSALSFPEAVEDILEGGVVSLGCCQGLNMNSPDPCRIPHYPCMEGVGTDLTRLPQPHEIRYRTDNDETPNRTTLALGY